MRPKLVIFDFDGTLADSFPWFCSVLNDVAHRYRFRRVEPHEIDALRGLSAGEMVRRFGVPAWKMLLIANHMRKLKARQRERAPLFDGAGDMLRRLSEAGVTIAIVSSDAEANIRATLGAELSSLVSRFECGASLFGKAAKFRKVLRLTGCDPSAAITIGDEIRDLDAARAAGIAFGAVTWGYTHADALEAHAPDEVFKSINEICGRLCGESADPIA
jgi:phosphoglycolate phosphatase